MRKSNKTPLPRLLLCIVLCLLIGGLQAKSIVGKVIGVKDGDTIVVLKNKTSYTIRLDGIDCPEKKQAFGERAKQFASNAVFGKTVRVEYTKKDRYKRILGKVYYGKNLELNQELLKAGLAWHYKAYNKDEYLAKLEQQARRQGRGLWADKHAIPPWEFRRRK